MDTTIKAMIEGAVQSYINSMLAKVPAGLQAPAQAAITANENFALAALEYYSVNAIAAKAPSLLAALKAAFPSAFAS